MTERIEKGWCLFGVEEWWCLVGVDEWERVAVVLVVRVEDLAKTEPTESIQCKITQIDTLDYIKVLIMGPSQEILGLVERADCALIQMEH